MLRRLRWYWVQMTSPGAHDDVVRSLIETARLGNWRDIGTDLNTISVWIEAAVRRYHDQISKTIALIRLP